jgi:hypothetical protein
MWLYVFKTYFTQKFKEWRCLYFDFFRCNEKVQLVLTIFYVLWCDGLASQDLGQSNLSLHNIVFSSVCSDNIHPIYSFISINLHCGQTAMFETWRHCVKHCVVLMGTAGLSSFTCLVCLPPTTAGRMAGHGEASADWRGCCTNSLPKPDGR